MLIANARVLTGGKIRPGLDVLTEGTGIMAVGKVSGDKENRRPRALLSRAFGPAHHGCDGGDRWTAATRRRRRRAAAHRRDRVFAHTECDRWTTPARRSRRAPQRWTRRRGRGAGCHLEGPSQRQPVRRAAGAVCEGPSLEPTPHRRGLRGAAAGDHHRAGNGGRDGLIGI